MSSILPSLTELTMTRHPKTGEPIRPLWIRPDGRACWPIMGAADDPDPDPGNNDPEGGNGFPENTKPADMTADERQAYYEHLGFPENTKPADMTVEQRAAYYQHQAQKHEKRNKQLLRVTGGKYGDDLKTDLDELERLRTAQLTDAEKAVEEAKKTVRAEVQREYGTKLVAAEFRAALGHVDGERRDQIIEGLTLEKYLTSDGDVDTDKVKSFAAAIAPADKGEGNNGRDRDYGGGRRDTKTKSGVAAGAAMFDAARKKSTSTT